MAINTAGTKVTLCKCAGGKCVCVRELISYKQTMKLLGLTRAQVNWLRDQGFLTRVMLPNGHSQLLKEDVVNYQQMSFSNAETKYALDA